MKQSIVPDSPNTPEYPEIARENKIPEKVLDLYIEMFEKRGFSLELKYYPDFEKAHPNEMFRNFKCSAGSTYTVVTLAAHQPIEWIFKIRKGNILLPHTNQITGIKLSGNTFWSDFITTASAASVVGQIDTSLKVSAYDNMDTQLPVYIFVFRVDKTSNTGL